MTMPSCSICAREFLPIEAIHRKRFTEKPKWAKHELSFWGLAHPPCVREYDFDQLRPNQIAEQIYPFARRAYAAA